MTEVEFDDNSALNRVAKSTASQLAANALLIIGGVASLGILTRGLGTHLFGQFTAITTVFSIFVILSDLGVNALVMREVAKTPSEAATIVSTSVSFRGVAGLAMAPLCWVLMMIVAPERTSHVAIAGALLVVMLPLEAINGVVQSYFYASIRGQVPATMAVLKLFAYVAGLAVAIWMHWGIIGCAAAFWFSGLLNILVFLVLTRREIPLRLVLRWTAWMASIRDAFGMGIIQVVGVIYLRVDIVLLGLMSTATAVGVYGVAYSYVNVMVFVPTVILTAVFPLVSRGAPRKVRRIVRGTTAVLTQLGMLAVVAVVLVGRDVIIVISGPKYESAYIPLVLLTVATLFVFMRSSFSWAASAMKKIDRFVFISLAGLVLNVALNVALIPVLGIRGSAIATLVTDFLAFVAQAILFHRNTGIKVSILPLMWKPLIASGVVFGLFALGLKIPGPHIVSMLAEGSLIVLEFALIIVLLRGIPGELTGPVLERFPRWSKTVSEGEEE